MSADRELGRRLRELRAPDEASAEERSWDVVRAAYAERTVTSPAPRTRRLALALAAGVSLLAIGLSPAGAEVGDFVADVTGIGEEDARPALRSLPAAGALLVESGDGVWVVRDDGSKRLLGEYEDAVWSPNGLYIAAGADRELVTLEPDGTVRWTYPAPGEVHDPRWAGTEVDTRIAYRSGDDLRVIAGDGDPDSDRVIARDVAPVPPAWRPVGGSKIEPGIGIGPYVLTYVTASGGVKTVNAESGREVDVARDDRRRLTEPPSKPGVTRELSPDGRSFAIVEHVGASDRVILSAPGRPGGDVLFSARGRLTGPTWSPDGRWLLVGWPAADQWLFIEVESRHRVVAFDNITEQFDPGETGAGSFPRVAGWTLPSR